MLTANEKLTQKLSLEEVINEIPLTCEYSNHYAPYHIVVENLFYACEQEDLLEDIVFQSKSGCCHEIRYRFYEQSASHALLLRFNQRIGEYFDWSEPDWGEEISQKWRHLDEIERTIDGYLKQLEQKELGKDTPKEEFEELEQKIRELLPSIFFLTKDIVRLQDAYPYPERPKISYWCKKRK